MKDFSNRKEIKQAMGKWCEDLLKNPTILKKVILKKLSQEEKYNTSHLKRERDSIKKIVSKTL